MGLQRLPTSVQIADRSSTDNSHLMYDLDRSGQIFNIFLICMIGIIYLQSSACFLLRLDIALLIQVFIQIPRNLSTKAGERGTR